MVSAVSDTSSEASGVSSQDSSVFEMEWEAVLYQRRLAKEGRSHEIRLTPMQKVAVVEFGLHAQYPAFTMAVDDHYHTMMYALRSLRRAAREEEKDDN